MFTSTEAANNSNNLFIGILCAVQCNKLASKADSSHQNKMNISDHV